MSQLRFYTYTNTTPREKRKRESKLLSCPHHFRSLSHFDLLSSLPRAFDLRFSRYHHFNSPNNYYSRFYAATMRLCALN